MPSRTTASDPAPDAAPDETAGAEAGSTPEAGFFGWLRRLDLPRRPGWLGGVCAGLAERIGVDPVLVRGVVVVIAVLGGPVALLYALAWFLLPDEDGTIHAQELGRGRITRAVPGIAAIFLLSFLPLAQGFWFAGAFYWADLGAGGVVLRVLWTAALLACAIWIVVWLARRASASDVTTIPATTDDRPDTVPASPGEPPAPPADGASPDDLAAWRRGQDEWQTQRATWVAEQRRTEREQRAAAALQRSRDAVAAAQERARLDRLTRPRAHAGIVALIFGAALVAGAIAAAVARADDATTGAHWVVGAATVSLVLAVGIVAVGLARRRSRGLTSLSITAVFALAIAITAFALPIDRAILPLGTVYSLPRDDDGRSFALGGTTQLWVIDRTDGDPIPTLDHWQVSGAVEVLLDPDAAVRIELVTESAGPQVPVVEEYGESGGRTSFYTVRDGRLELSVGSGIPDAVFRVHLASGAYLSVVYRAAEPTTLELDPVPDEQSLWGDLQDPTPTPTEGVAP